MRLVRRRLDKLLGAVAHKRADRPRPSINASTIPCRPGSTKPIDGDARRVARQRQGAPAVGAAMRASGPAPTKQNGSGWLDHHRRESQAPAELTLSAEA